MRLLVAIITGGRPALADRPTRLLVPALRDAGFSDIEWVIREDHVDSYETDALPLNVYSVEWASRYARTHWRHPTAQWVHNGFFGAFPGREHIMRDAETRGYDAVLQLDDNIKLIGLLNATQPAYRSVLNAGTLVQILVNLALSTNGWMTGAQLSSVPPGGMTKIIRPPQHGRC